MDSSPPGTHYLESLHARKRLLLSDFIICCCLVYAAALHEHMRTRVCRIVVYVMCQPYRGTGMRHYVLMYGVLTTWPVLGGLTCMIRVKSEHAHVHDCLIAQCHKIWVLGFVIDYSFAACKLKLFDYSVSRFSTDMDTEEHIHTNTRSCVHTIKVCLSDFCPLFVLLL